ncbi:RHS repeat-associated core domain-containing protein [Leifsonia sp. NPDC056824]|uniref:RHS repeat-associated core domain-containing protein n=1 Tax=Leifsonia sp. NPDC056824 TaxID=3345953 RepID=UPI003673E3FD
MASLSAGTTSASGSSHGYSSTVNGGQSLTSATEGLSTSNPTSTFTYGNTSAQTQYLPSGGSNDAGNAMTIGYNGPGNPTTTTNTSTTVQAKLNYPLTGNVGLPSSAAAPDNGSNVTSYSYTNYQLTGITPVTGTSLTARTLTYDAFGRLYTQTDGRGNTTTYTYDNDDRLLTTAFSDGTTTVTNVYDSVGDRTSQVSASGTITNVFDQLGRLTSTVNTAGGDTEKYGYDLASNQVTTTDSRGTTTNVFDASGVLTQTQYAHSGGTQYTNFATDANGRRTDTWLQSTSNPTDNSGWSAHTHYSYDTSNRVTAITADKGPASGPTAQMNVTYSFDPSTTGTTCQSTVPAAGDRSKIQSSVDHLLGQTTIYCYDTSNRLTKMVQSGGTGTNNSYAYAYDVRGNRTSATVNGGTPQTWTYNAANEITNTGYSYDGAGNLTATPTGSFTYNGAEQMMTSVVGGTTYHYTYAGASQNAVLSEQLASGSTVQITYGRSDQNGNPVIEGYKVDSGQAYVENDPVTGAANMLRTSSGIACLYVYDGIGNPVALLTDFQTTSYSYTYDPYGLPTLTYTSGGNGITQNPYLFKGGIQDRATGFVKFGGRWYDPATGRWTQQDTLDAPLDPANANRYMFAGDDPINNADPSGRDLQLLESIAAATLVTAVAGVALSSVCVVSALIGCITVGIFSLALGATVGNLTGDVLNGETYDPSQTY